MSKLKQDHQQICVIHNLDEERQHYYHKRYNITKKIYVDIHRTLAAYQAYKKHYLK